jgi:hypothetical protein
MNDFSVAFKVVSERGCPFYAADDLFVLTGQAVQLPIGHPSCLILIREMTNLLFNTIAPAAATGFEELKSETYNCGGCTGLIKFQIEDNPDAVEQGGDISSTEATREKDGGGSTEKQKGKREEIVVSGQLSEISPSELLQFFHMHQKTGKLMLDAVGGVGRVAFREGAIIGAKFMEHENKEAVFALLRENQGRFNFVNGIPSSLLEVEEIGDFMMLLMEGIKRMDEEEG